MYRVQYHGKCSFTCFKSKGFTNQCRLAKPSEEFSKTIIHTLRENRSSSGEILIPIRDTVIDPPPVLGNLSIPVPDLRVHWIDHQRLNAVDSNMVDGNICLSAALGWNTSVNFIAAPGPAQSAIYYISKYMSKNPTQAKSVLPLILLFLKGSFIPRRQKTQVPQLEVQHTWRKSYLIYLMGWWMFGPNGCFCCV